MKKFLKVLCLCLIMAIALSAAACGDKSSTEPIEYDDPMQEFIETYDKNLMFSDDKVCIILTDEASSRIDEYTAEDFSEINPTSIKKYFNNIIFITLSETGRENVLRAVYLLRLRPDVEHAEPDFIESGDV